MSNEQKLPLGTKDIDYVYAQGGEGQEEGQGVGVIAKRLRDVEVKHVVEAGLGNVLRGQYKVIC